MADDGGNHLNRILIQTLLAIGTISLVANAGALSVAVPWVNGDFEAGAALWGLASTNSVADHDGDGDQEVSFVGCGDGTWQMARGLSKGAAPGTADIAFTVETGAVDFWDFRMILADANDPESYANNAFQYDVTGTLQPNWFDDQVLSWYSWSSPLVGSIVLDPVDAVGYNIPGWAGMDAAAREAYLATTVHATIVMYACTTNGATLDSFGFVI